MPCKCARFFSNTLNIMEEKRRRRRSIFGTYHTRYDEYDDEYDYCFLVYGFGLNLKAPSSLGHCVMRSVFVIVTFGPRMPFQLFSLACTTPTTTESENVGEL